jgi:adenylate cyclase
MAVALRAVVDEGGLARASGALAPPTLRDRALGGALDVPRSVAVLPFLDLSATRDQDYLCEGIAEEILTALSQVDGLRVAARSSSFLLKSQGLDARAVGTRLGVDAVLEGALRKAGDRLRVTVQLVDVVGGYQSWSQRFDGNVADVFDIQDDIARAVATELRGALGASSQQALRRPETTPEAYECFLRGRQLLRSHDEVRCGAAERALGRAIALDPTYAPAYAALAQVHAFIAEWYGGGESAREAADRASARAVELGPDLAEAHVARAAVWAMRGDYPAAERAYQEAIRRSPQSFDAHYHLARVYVQTGQDGRAAETFARAAALQVDDFQCLILAANPLRRLGRHAEADASRREGIRRVERVLEIDPTNTRALSLGACALAEGGDAERAIAWCERAVVVASDDLAMNYNAACVYARLGRRDEALERLERNFARGIGKRDWVEHDTDWDPYRDDPRFQALLAKLS